MKVKVKLKDEQVNLLKANGTVLSEDGEPVWYNLPQWFKEVDGGFEVYMPWELPTDVRDRIIKYDAIPVETYKDFLGKRCEFNGIDCMITAIPQWFIRMFTLTPMRREDSIEGKWLGQSAELSIERFEKEVVCAHS